MSNLKLAQAISDPQETATPPSEGTKQLKVITMRYLLQALLKYGASDLHLKAGRPPMFRINGKLVPAKLQDLTASQTRELISGVLNQKSMDLFEKNGQVDCSFAMESIGRFRANVYSQRNSIAAAIRVIPMAIPTIESLNLPVVLKELALTKRGLVLVTGATGAGKSTSMAALVQHINANRQAHIITIEDPIEFIYRDQKSSVSQREIGTDSPSLHDAFIGALRQDPDVIVLGELRDQQTIETALTAAETGHLVIATLHTTDARSTIDRIVDVFPAAVRSQIRVQLSSCLQAIVSQKLVPRSDGSGRIPVCEVLIKSPTIENLILNNEHEKIAETIASSTTYYKMQTFNQALEKLVMAGVVTNEDAIYASNSPEDLKMRLAGFHK